MRGQCVQWILAAIAQRCLFTPLEDKTTAEGEEEENPFPALTRKEEESTLLADRNVSIIDTKLSPEDVDFLRYVELLL